MRFLKAAGYHPNKLKYLISIFVILLTSSCSFPQQTTTVKVILNPNVSGWYFVQLTVDTNSQYRTTTLKFQDTTKIIRVSIKDIDNTIISPIDMSGNDVSDRLQFSLSRELNRNTYVVHFYNPTSEELKNIVNWNPTDDRAEAIYQEGEKEFNKYFKYTYLKVDR